MAAFARHLEGCGFESIVAVEHTILATQYDSIYPYDRSGRVELAADCPVPDPLDLLSFLAGYTDVGKHRARRFQDGARDDVLRGYQLDLLALAVQFALEHGIDRRIRLGEAAREHRQR